MIDKRYAELHQATLAMDAHRVADWMSHNATKEFFYRTAVGTMLTSDQTVSLLRQEFDQIGAVKASDYKVTNFGVHGDHLSCSVTTHQVLTLKGGKRIASTSTSVDTWVERNGAWKLTSVVTTSEVPK